MVDAKAPSARVLVVDDEPNILELLTAALRLSGFEVRGAASGAEALRAAGDFRPHIVVLDVMLPDQDGFTVARRLREGGDAVPVLFLTCLLYTSPSPRDQRGSRMPSSA